MNPQDLEVLATLIGAGAAVVGIVITVLDRARKNARELVKEKDDIRQQAYAAGVQSQAAAISLLQAQLGDARNERDVARADARDWEDRYMRSQRDK